MSGSGSSFSSCGAAPDFSFSPCSAAPDFDFSPADCPKITVTQTIIGRRSPAIYYCVEGFLGPLILRGCAPAKLFCGGATNVELLEELIGRSFSQIQLTGRENGDVEYSFPLGLFNGLIGFGGVISREEFGAFREQVRKQIKHIEDAKDLEVVVRIEDFEDEDVEKGKPLTYTN